MTHEHIKPTYNLYPPETTAFRYRQLQFYVASFLVRQCHAVNDYKHCSVQQHNQTIKDGDLKLVTSALHKPHRDYDALRNMKPYFSECDDFTL